MMHVYYHESDHMEAVACTIKLEHWFPGAVCKLPQSLPLSGRSLDDLTFEHQLFACVCEDTLEERYIQILE